MSTHVLPHPWPKMPSSPSCSCHRATSWLDLDARFDSVNTIFITFFTPYPLCPLCERRGSPMTPPSLAWSFGPSLYSPFTATGPSAPNLAWLSPSCRLPPHRIHTPTHISQKTFNFTCVPCPPLCTVWITHDLTWPLDPLVQTTTWPLILLPLTTRWLHQHTPMSQEHNTSPIHHLQHLWLAIITIMQHWKYKTSTC